MLGLNVYAMTGEPEPEATVGMVER